MKYLITILALIALLGICSCKNPCKGYVSYNKIDPRLRSYFFQAASYWVYEDSVSGNLDSQRVFKYVDKYVQTDPCQVLSHTLPTQDCCGPYNYDLLQMAIATFRGNGLDSFFCTAGGDGYSLEPYNQAVYVNGEALFSLNPGSPPGANTKYRLYYLGQVNNFVQNGVNYTNVSIFQAQYDSRYTYYFTCTTDLYFCSGYGIIKKVEHTESGDIVWKLTRFNLQ